MAESITISKLPPPLKSMQYGLLRETGLQRLLALSGSFWTDFNAHDPGVTILEVLAYAITDLGYRTNYDIRDILEPNPALPADIRNFFTAAQILPNCPVTFDDYRKLLMDVEVPTGDPDFPYAGIRNAWLTKSLNNEIPFYLDRSVKSLTYTIPPYAATSPQLIERIRPKVLYDVLLEFDNEGIYDDLNENTINGRYVVTGITNSPPLQHTELNGSILEFEIEMPRWDTPGVDFTDPVSILAAAKNPVVNFSRHSSAFKLDDYMWQQNTGMLWLGMSFNIVNTLIPEGDYIAAEINKLIYDSVSETGLVYDYIRKVELINKIVTKARASLMANRNLGEDFFRIAAVKIEEIAFCADIDLRPDADIEKVQADVYYAVEQFLSPTIFFYSLQEMIAKGKTIDKIFEGPLLEHGFIDNEEMLRTTRRETIHVSDIINIIMDIDGVMAVRDVRVANIPLDNDLNLPTKQVRWCLDLNIEYDYIPRLSTDRSKVTFYKDKLPYIADQDEAALLLATLNNTDRPQKLHNTPLDLPVQKGEYLEIDSYTSIQDDFPLVYGIGPEGLPATATTERRSQALQLKGYLMFFDQLLANYLSQLAHVKDLFSMDPGKDVNGDYIIDRTYFTQTLLNIVPDASPLYASTPATHADRLQELAEERDAYFIRRNRILDHLAARFSEQFTDYAMLVYRLDGKKAPEELLDDKLGFLNNYPLISSARDKGFNYESPGELWSINNISGLARRVSFLAGFDPVPASALVFSSNFIFTPDLSLAGPYTLSVSIPGTPSITFAGQLSFSTVVDALLGMEAFIAAGSEFDCIVAVDDTTNIDIDVRRNVNTILSGNCYFQIRSQGVVLAESGTIATPASIADLIDFIENIQLVFTTELINNPESNRNNFTCVFERYVKTQFPVDIVPGTLPCPDTFEFWFEYYAGHYDATPTPEMLLTGTLNGLPDPLSTDSLTDQGEQAKHHLIMNMLRSATDIENYTYTFNTDPLPVEVFNVVDHCGNPLATSVEKDFSANLRTALTTATNGSFDVVDSISNNGNYLLTGAAASTTHANRLDLTTSGTIPAAVADGFVKVTISASISGVNISTDGYLDFVSADAFNFKRVLYPGDGIILTDSSMPTPNILTYTVVRVDKISATESRVFVRENIVPGQLIAPVTLSVDKTYEIVDIDTGTGRITVEHLADVDAATEMAEQIRQRFFNHEGMHVVEHVLLRPKYNTVGEAVDLDPANRNMLDPLVDTNGFAFYVKKISGYVISSPTLIVLTGDYVSDLSSTGAQITIQGSTGNDGVYNVASVVLSAGNTEITIDTALPDSTADGAVYFNAQKLIDSYGLNNQDIVVIDAQMNSADVYSLQINISGSQDGQNNGSYGLSGVPTTSDNIHWTFPVIRPTRWKRTLGKAVYVKVFSSYAIASAYEFVISGDYTSEIQNNQRIRITGSPLNDNDYIVQQVTFFAGNTTIKVYNSIPDGTSTAGTLSYSVSKTIVSYDPNQTDILVDDTLLSVATIENLEVYIINSRNGVNDGKYKLSGAPTASGSYQLFEFSKRTAVYRDKFLPVNLDTKCDDCEVDDPYSYIVSVILPSWQGRFQSTDFRSFLERTIRLEAPAHLLLNICWINCERMDAFEKQYKNWLIENARSVKRPQALSFALADFIDVLTEVRSEQPRGTLHSCEEDPKLKNSIILNNSALGTF